MIETIKNKISDRNFKINSAIVAAGAAVGTVVGAEKNKLNKLELDTELTKEYSKYLSQVSENSSVIKNTVELAKKNQEAKDNFNTLCDYCYNTVLKNKNRINIVMGIAIGATIGLLGVMAKSKFLKGKINKDNSNKKQMLDIHS